MKAHLYNFENYLIDFENRVLSLEVENPAIFWKFIRDMRSADAESDIAFEKDGELIKTGDIEVVIDYDFLNLNNKSIVNKIFNKIENEFKSDYDKMLSFNDIAAQFKSKLLNLIDNIDIEFSFNDEFDVKSAFSLINLKPDSYAESLTDKIMQYMNIAVEIGLCKVMCFVNIKSFLDFNAIENIIKFSHYKKMPIVLLESKHNDNKFENEIKVLIDKDLCDIII